MNDKILKEKSFEIIRKMEADGWELLVLDSYVTTKTQSPPTTSWFAVMVKDGLHIYLEVEREDQVEIRDVKMICPDCGIMKHNFLLNEDEEICPNCETVFVYEKEINCDYISLAVKDSLSASSVQPCCMDDPQGIFKEIQKTLEEYHDMKMKIEELERAQYALLEKAHKLCDKVTK